jgi:dTDP-4-amino-4,6-dideoxygalactose transaminase
VTAYRIPFNRPTIVGTEPGYLAKAMADGQLGGDGPFTRRCEKLLEEIVEVPKVLLTTSCTVALEMCGLLLDLAAGDEVIVPSFTFVSSINSLVLRGVRPVFADVRPDTFNLDEERLESLVTSRTRAIVAVHYGGVGAEMDRIGEIAGRHGVAVVEDSAHGLFGRYRGRALGSFAPLAGVSFHETKNLTCGEGGALLVGDPGYLERAEVLRDKGTDRARFLRGEVDVYSWVDVGSSYLPADLLAAFLYAQLEARETIQTRRRRVWQRYRDGLSAFAAERGLQLPIVPPHCEPAYHMFHVLLRSDAERARVIADLKAAGIQAVFHYPPLHLSAMGARFGGKTGDCPVSEDVSRRLLRLPFYTDLAEADQEEVIAAFCRSVDGCTA